MTDRPLYWTREAWATLSEQQRELLRLGRIRRVEDLRVLHHARYHAPAELAALAIALRRED